jgi:hypothetical protein
MSERFDKLLNDAIAKLERLVDLTGDDWNTETMRGLIDRTGEIARLKGTVECTTERYNRYQYLNTLCDQAFDMKRLAGGVGIKEVKQKLIERWGRDDPLRRFVDEAKAEKLEADTLLTNLKAL